MSPHRFISETANNKNHTKDKRKVWKRSSRRKRSLSKPKMNLTDQPQVAQHLYTITIIQLSFYVIIFLIGGIGNTLVLLVIKGKKTLRKTNDYFILNLAIGDLLVIFISIPVDFHQKLAAFPSGTLLCKFLWPGMTAALLTSIFTLTCMAVERRRVIVKPMAPKLRGVQVFWVIVTIWSAAIACVLPLSIVAYPGAGSFCIEKWPSFPMRKAYTASLLALQYVVPLVMITVAYANLSQHLKASHNFRTNCNASNSSTSYGRQIIKLQQNESARVNKNLRTIVILFAIFMLPKQIVWLWLDFGDGGDFEYFSDVLTFSEVMLYIHSSCNPLVYGTIMKDYRIGFTRYLRQICPCCYRICGFYSHVYPLESVRQSRGSNVIGMRSISGAHAP